MKKLIILIGLLPVLLFSQTPQDSLTAELAIFAREEAVIGFAVAILNRDGVLFSNGFGFSDNKNKILYTTNTVQPIASISKTLIGVSLLKAKELGLLKLDDPINRYLKFEIANPYFPRSEITIRHLANHTSSLKDTRHYEKSYVFSEPVPDLHKNFSIFPPKEAIMRLFVKRMVKNYNKNIDLPLTDFITNIYVPGGIWYNKKGSFLKERPGDVCSYSNNGAAIASLVIEKASGMKYTDFVKTYILDPLGMKNSGWDMEEFEEGVKSRLYPLHTEIPYFKLITLADGGFITSVSDFSRYLTAIIRGYFGEDNIITSESYDQMLKENISFNNGIFWDIRVINTEYHIGHTGGDPGVNTAVFFDKRNGLGYICFLNTDTPSSAEIESILGIMIKYSERFAGK